jgi:hypothetical protein
MFMMFLLWSSKFVVRRSLFAGSSIDVLNIATGFEEFVKEMWIVCEDLGAQRPFAWERHHRRM